MTKGAFAVSGVGGVFGLIGLAELVAHGPKEESGWIWLATGCLVLFLSQIWAVQQALEEREKARASNGSITGVDIGDGAFFGGQISMQGNIWSVGPREFLKRQPRNRRWWHRLALNPGEQKALAARGRDLGDQLFAFAAERRLVEPSYRVPPQGLPPEEAKTWRLEYDGLRDQHTSETRAEHLRRFVGDIAVWLDDVEGFGIQLSRSQAELSPTWYMTVAGPMPIEETGRAICVLAHRIARERPPWWRRRLSSGIDQTEPDQVPRRP